MSLLTDGIYPHIIVYWAPALLANGKQEVDNNGQVVFETPVEICGRWTEFTEMFMDRKGNEQQSMVKIRLKQDVEELGVLWLGCFKTIVSRTLPFSNPGAQEIRKFKRVANRNADAYLRFALL